MIRIILADDHKIMRQGLLGLLEKQDDFEVIAATGDGRSAIRLTQEMSPDIVIMDINMPDLNGIEATRAITSGDRRVRVIALSMHSDKKFVTEMFRAGASGYVLKDCALDELVFAIRSVLKSQIYLSPEICGFELKGHLQRSLESPKTGSSAFSVLTNREREVLQLFAEGKTTKEIADLLKVSPKTVETQRQSIFNKLNIHSIAELTKYAIREGLTSL